MNNGGTALARPTRYRVPTQPTKTMTLEALLDEVGWDSVDLAKIDIEGWEYHALAGSPRVFSAGRIRALFIEFHPKALTAAGRSVAETIRAD